MDFIFFVNIPFLHYYDRTHWRTHIGSYMWEVEVAKVQYYNLENLNMTLFLHTVTWSLIPSGSGFFPMVHTHTNLQHQNWETESAQWADSVKICNRIWRWASGANFPNMFFLTSNSFSSLKFTLINQFQILFETSCIYLYCHYICRDGDLAEFLQPPRSRIFLLMLQISFRLF